MELPKRHATPLTGSRYREWRTVCPIGRSLEQIKAIPGHVNLKDRHAPTWKDHKAAKRRMVTYGTRLFGIVGRSDAPGATSRSIPVDPSVPQAARPQEPAAGEDLVCST